MDDVGPATLPLASSPVEAGSSDSPCPRPLIFIQTLDACDNSFDRAALSEDARSRTSVTRSDSLVLDGQQHGDVGAFP